MFHNQLTQNKKMCQYFRRGFCRYGYNCKFVHENLQQAKCNYCDKVFMSHYELKHHIMNYYTSNTTQVRNCRYGEECRDLASGYCRFGHFYEQTTTSNKQPRPCRYQEDCFRIPRCRFSHYMSDFPPLGGKFPPEPCHQSSQW